MKDFSYFLKTWDDRVDICRKYEAIFEKKFNASNLQNVKTPRFLINKMIDKVSVLENKKILVMFNFEFIDALIFEYNVKPENIYFVADCHEMMCKVIRLVYNLPINNIVYHTEYKDNSLTSKVKKLSMKFDLCITNPPYNRGLDLKIIDSVKDICDEIVCIHPSMWLLDIKGDREGYSNLKNSLKLNDLEFFNGNPIFNIAQFLPIVITHIDKNKKDNIIDIKWFDEEFNITDINNVTKYGKDWIYLIYNFYSKIFDVCEKDNINNHNKVLENIKNKEYIVQLAYIRGHVYGDVEQMLSDDFYTIVMRGEENLGIRDIVDTPVFYEFETKNEQLNFLNYLKTDFARFCLTFYKNNGHLISGNICRLIPWLDFTQEWNDEKLFKHFDIDKPTQDYIRKFLPDYYGIRKEKTPEILVKEIIQKYYLDEGYGNIFENLDEGDEEKIAKVDTYLASGEKYKFSFYTIEQRDNFAQYITNTKFVSFLNTLVKVNKKNERKLCIIPDMDFSEEWNDEKLFKYFNIPEELQKYILESK